MNPVASQLGQHCLNKDLIGLTKSDTLNINEKSIELQKQGRNVYRFGLGQSPFPVPKSVVQKLAQSSGEKDYMAVSGLKELRSCIAGWLNKL